MESFSVGNRRVHRVVEWRAETAISVGDVLHHPLQILNPDWNSIFCEDADPARAARRHVLARAADEAAILVPAHFAGDHTVRIERRDGGFAQIPALIPAFT